MEEKDYLGLSLTLLPPSSSPSPQPSSSSCNHRPPQWRHLLLPHAGIDVNQTPPSARNSEASAPLSPREISSSSAKRTSGAVSDEDEDGDGDGDGGRKKLRLSKEQSAVLEESFKEHSTLNPKQKLALAKRLHLRPRQVEVWFQNRRARTKLKQTEVDCELLRRCCHDLTEENRRLQKEVQELRALKLSPQFYMHMTPPTTLTLCPSCERISSAATPTPLSKNPPLRPAAEQHQFLLHHRRSGAAAPWPPIPLRPSYLDAPPQRS